MSLRIYFFSIITSIILSLSLWLLLLFNVNPYQAPSWIIATFYFTFFLFFTGIFAIIGYKLKVWASNREVIFSLLAPTLRQSIILSMIITGLLLFEQIKVLNWWVACLFVISLFMLELFFRSKK